MNVRIHRKEKLATLILSFAVMLGCMDTKALPPPVSVFNSIVNPHGDFVQDASWDNAPPSNTCTPNASHTYNIMTGDSIWTNCTAIDFSGTITLNVKSGAVLHMFGNASVTGNVSVKIEQGGKAIIDGNLSLSGNSSISVDGRLIVKGNVTKPNGNPTFDCNGATGLGTVSIGGTGCEYCTDGLGLGCVTLPVNLLDFSAFYDPDNKLTSLQWETEEELNNAYFDVERSYNGFEFERIGTVNGSGYSASLKQYSYEDITCNYIGIVYYRIKQVDHTGFYSYSTVRAVSITHDGTIDVKIYPNPAQAQDFNINVSGVSGEALLVLYDVHGNLLFSKTVTYEDDGVLSAKEINSKLVQGIYYIHASSNGKLVNKKLIVR